METIIIDENTEKEEGEIDDDDLESISDVSISVPLKTGKLNSNKESLPTLSLSSVSDIDVSEYAPNINKRKARKRPCKRKRLNRYMRHRDKFKPDSSNSDSDEDVTISKKLLKDAIRIGTKQSLNNSLRTRLKGMVNKQEQTDQIIVVDENSSDVRIINSEPTVEDIIINGEGDNKDTDDNQIENDDELIQLRLEALRTAVLRKCEYRKRKNMLLNQPNSDVNKENSSVNVNNSTINVEGSENVDNVAAVKSDDDEDEDILRAILLASVSKKITNKADSTKLNVNKENLVKYVASSTKPKTDITIPKIPRFIISVNNSDSDSEDNVDLKVPEVQKQVECDIEKFLKQQRAEVEAKELIMKKKEVPTVKLNKINKTPINKILGTNTLYKLLPKNKQLEYEKLIEKLKSAEKKPRIRRLSNRIDSKSVKNVRSKVSWKNNTENNVVAEKTVLQRTIKNVQTEVDGRLQIKGKYNELAPLMKKLNEANQEMKKHQNTIKQLLNQLKEARNQCTKSQQTVSEILKEFLKKKEEIDKRSINKNLQCRVVIEKCPVNLTDPNDIIFKRIDQETFKYTSPLDNKGSTNFNPMEILCPFEINGSCRDNECKYNHCNKISELP